MKALIFDLDDTLLNSKKQIGMLTRRALIDSHNAGYQLVLATSRPIRAVRHFVDNEILALCATTTLNGCVIHKQGQQDSPQIVGRLGTSTLLLFDTLS